MFYSVSGKRPYGGPVERLLAAERHVDRVCEVCEDWLDRTGQPAHDLIVRDQFGYRYDVVAAGLFGIDIVPRSAPPPGC